MSYANGCFMIDLRVSNVLIAQLGMVLRIVRTYVLGSCLIDIGFTSKSLKEGLEGEAMGGASIRRSPTGEAAAERMATIRGDRQSIAHSTSVPIVVVPFVVVPFEFMVIHRIPWGFRARFAWLAPQDS